MVERITPATAASVAALATVLAAGARGAAAGAAPAAAAVAAGMAAAAAGIVGMHAAARLRVAGRLAASAGFGLAAGGLLSLSLAFSAWLAHPGLAPGLVGGVEAVTIEDSRPSRSGGSVVTVRLQRAIGRDGLEAASAAGEALAVLPHADRLSAGERVALRGALVPSPAGRPPFVLRAAAVERRGFASPLARLRADARGAVERAADGLGYPASALLLALFLGDRYGIPAEMEDVFLHTGTLHLLALSGTHLAAIYLLAGTVLRPLLRPRARWAAVAVLAAAFLWLAGPAPSLLRAGLAFLAAGVASLAGRDHRPVNLLGLVLLVHLVLDPADAFTLGFQLSYLAVAGLVAGDALLSRRLQKWVPPVAAVPVAATAGAQLATLPLSLAAFGAWYPIGFVATLLGGPLVMLFLCAGLVALPLLRIAPVAEAAPQAFGLLYRVLLEGGRLLARAPAVLLAAAGPAAALALVATGRRREQEP
jgi:competence protein ComEC